jgi:SAM-dependent methyltransferase
MNRLHRWYCRSSAWRETVSTALLPWVLRGIDLGDDVLEVGPGPGITTDVLRSRTSRLTCVEIDVGLAGALARRLRGTNVAVVHGDATRLPFPDGRFSAVVSCTMLHHVPSPALQDRLLAEGRRVLRPGGILVGSDSRTSTVFRLFHLFDTLVPVDPQRLPARLAAAGYAEVRVDVERRAFRFRARRAPGS